MTTIKKLKTPDFSHATLSALLKIRENNYLGQPRRVKGGYAQVDYPPAEIEEQITLKENKLDEKGELEHFKQYDLAMKQKEAIEAVYKAIETALKYGCPIVSMDNMNAMYEELKDL